MVNLFLFCDIIINNNFIGILFFYLPESQKYSILWLIIKYNLYII